MVCSSVFFVVFFKQKTAYEMRISDWSSDVCSSDLQLKDRKADAPTSIAERDPGFRGGGPPGESVRGGRQPRHHRQRRQPPHPRAGKRVGRASAATDAARTDPDRCRRSEEHTSDLQSLMRISYAVFC